MKLFSSRRPALRILDALAGPHGIDGYLEQVDPLLVTRECRAEVTAVDRHTEGATTLKLRPNRAWSGFEAGQFINLAVEIDGVRHQRCYSPACREGRHSELEITIRRHHGGLVSNFLAENAKPGMIFNLSQAEGSFQLPKSRPDSILLIGGGSGITPLMAMIRTLVEEGHDRPVALLQYAPEPARTIYRTELDRLAAEWPGFTLLRSYTQAPGKGDLDGYFDLDHLPGQRRASGPKRAPIPRSSFHFDFNSTETFACGPPALLDAVRDTWTRHGAEDRLHVESFVAPTFVPAGEPGQGEIRFAAAGIEVTNSGASLLEQAEEAGLQPEYGCRMGICHSCTRRKLTGTHQDLVTGEVSSAPDEEIQLCVSAALGDLTVDL